MVFEILKGHITSLNSDWSPDELEFESYIVPKSSEDPLLEASVFGEPLLFLQEQVRTKAGKRADILALDRAGNSVIIELKRDTGALGVETQALQYLADFSIHKGKDFIQHFSKLEGTQAEERIRGFLGDSVPLDQINSRSRIILVARSFDPSIFSMGEWLSENGVPFRCIAYTPFEIEGREFLTFSTEFDRTPIPIFPLLFQSRARAVAFFWHNIGAAEDEWWRFLVSEKVIPASFSNQPGDEGERLLRSYIPGDTIIAYANRYGAVGWGTIDKEGGYELVPLGSKADKRNGQFRHRRSITWKSVASKLSDGIAPDKVYKDFGIYHPVPTSVSIADDDAKRLITALNEKFK